MTTTAEPSIPDRPLLHGQKVWLRPMEERDIAAFVAGVNDTEVGGWAGFGAPFSADTVRAMIARFAEHEKTGKAAGFAVCELGADAFIGSVWLRDVNTLDGSAELAIFMDRDHLGAGWGTDAQRVLLTFAFGTLRLHRVQLGVNPENARAVRSYEKVGFKLEARLRNAWITRGKPADLLIMAILADEFELPATA